MGDLRKFSWRRANPVEQARLDFFLVISNLLPQVRLCNISLSYRSDHSMVLVNVDFSNTIHG
jgi:hypothetical protein